LVQRKADEFLGLFFSYDDSEIVVEQDFSKNGILAIVLPDGILTNSNLSYIREFIEEHFK
jgi:hypothetical protein